MIPEFIFIAGFVIAADSAPRPPDVDGFVLFKVCSAGKLPTHFPEWVYVVPSSVVTVSDPEEAPPGCVAISSASNRRIYVYGTDVGVSTMLSEAKIKELSGHKN